MGVVCALKEVRWRAAFAAAMERAGKTIANTGQDANSAAWKVSIARQLRGIGAPCGWITENLHMGPVTSMRVYLARS